jgi:hypothetical protein
MINKTFTAKEVVEYLDLPYGRTTFYKKLREWGFLDEHNLPSKQMVIRNFIIVRKPLIYNGYRNTTTNVPIFTWDFILFIEKCISKNDAT